MISKLLKKNEKGFTLMEMLIVVAIIAVLIAIAIPTFTASLNKAKVATDEANIRAGYASAMAELIAGDTDVADGATLYLQKDGSVAATGTNFLGMVDLFVGTAATLLAAITSRLLGKIRFGGVPWLSVLPPILFNAVAIGAEWCYAATGSINVAFWAFAGQIALGQLPPCLLGVWLIHLLERRGLQNIIEGK